MTVFDLKQGEKAKILQISCSGAARARLSALGVKEGEEIEVLSFSLFKSGVLISCGWVRVGLRKMLAQRIEVAKWG